MDYNDLTINQLRFILLCIRAKADKRKIELTRETGLYDENNTTKEVIKQMENNTTKEVIKQMEMRLRQI
jgi:hypothetical protein